MAWYNKYRPQEFEEVIGQTLVKTVLQNAIGKQIIKHAYLFSGPKGTGKTTLARIFARKLIGQSEQRTNVDIIEMDAASNTGVDDIRQLIESSNVAPIDSKYKIYIIDEVHMLSKSAMNALLKTLEEPPSYLIFLLATTNPEKLLPTVLSRLTKLNLSSHTTTDIVFQLEKISQKEGVKIDKKALEIIAKHSNGGQRDAINHLETLASYGLDDYDSQNVSQLLGLLPAELLENIATSLFNKQLNTELLTKLSEYGYDGETFLGQLFDYLLEESLNGNQAKDELIIPLAEVISLRLPIYSAVSGLAILQSKLSSMNFLEQSKNLNKVPQKLVKDVINKNTNEQPAKINLETVSVQSASQQSANSASIRANIPEVEPENVPKTELVHEPHQNQPNTLNQENTIDFDNFCQLLGSDSTCPLTLKVMLNNIQLETQSPENLVISVSNTIFYNQLNSPKTQEYLKLKFKEISNYNGQIKIKKRETGQIDMTILEAPIQIPERVFEAESTPNQPTDSRSNLNTTLDLSQIEKTIFYEVYRELAPGMAEHNVPVFSGSIPKPPQTTDASSSEAHEGTWDDHVADFELE